MMLPCNAAVVFLMTPAILRSNTHRYFRKTPMWHYVKLIPIVMGITLVSSACKPTASTILQNCLFFLGQGLLSAAVTFHILDRWALNTRLDKMTESIKILEQGLATQQQNISHRHTHRPPIRLNQHHSRHHPHRVSSTNVSSYGPTSPQARPENAV